MLSPPEGLTIDDFDQIEAAVMETERGRWFLQEYARRLRAAETTEILTAIERLAERDKDQIAARRDAAEASVAMVDALQKLSLFVLGATAHDPSPQAAPTKLAPHAPPTEALAKRPSNDLQRRLNSLKELDALGVEAKVKLFG